VHVDGLVAIAGLIVGFAVGLTGMGGGALMTPVLVLVFGVQPLTAVSSDLVASLIMKPVGVAVHVGQRTVNWRLVAWLSAGSVPAAFAGVALLRLLGRGAALQSVVQLALGAVLFLAVGAMAVKWLIDRRRSTPRVPASGGQPIRVRRAATLLLGAGVGLIVGITSVGSGSLVIVLLLLLYPALKGSQTVGTDLTQAIPMVGSAALAHILFGDFQMALTLSIVAGSIPGVLLGSLVSSRGSTGFIRAALATVLLVSALKLVNVPTIDIGIVLLAAVVITVSAWAVAHVTRRTGPERAAS
jgi:uncharacterized membrane protein YfcA